MDNQEQILERLKKLEKAVPKATASLVALQVEEMVIDVKDLESYTQNLERRIVNIEKHVKANKYVQKQINSISLKLHWVMESLSEIDKLTNETLSNERLLGEGQ